MDSYTEFLGIGTSDAHKPTYANLRAEGMSEHAIETLMLSRDALHIMDAAEVADWLRLSQASYPLAVEDVWPEGTPDHWVDWTDFDPIDEQLAGIPWASQARGIAR